MQGRGWVGSRPTGEEMRTPGRCTNFEVCWLADGKRDIWVTVGDDFVCPVCARPLQAPSVHAITMRSLVTTTGVSLAMGTAAGLAAFGLIWWGHVLPHGHRAIGRTVIAQAAPTLPAAGLSYEPLRMNSRQAAPQAAKPAEPRAPAAPAATKPALPLVTQPVKLALEPLTPPPTSGKVRVIAAAAPYGAAPSAHAAAAALPITPPLPPLALPISFGKPVAPEDDRDTGGRKWHRHLPRPSWTGFLPAPGETPADTDGITEASQTYPVQQGDADDGGPTTTSAAVPSQQTDTLVPDGEAAGGVTIASSAVPTSAADSLPGPVRAGSPSFDADRTPADLTQVTVTGLPRAIASAPDLPAERVDAAMASAIDDAPDAAVQLARLAPALPAALVTPSYPPQAEARDQAGRVHVGCTITVHGIPADCAVVRQEGGTNFANAVLNWLHGGTVRYRPHFEHGRAVPEPRIYDVRFQP